jgi:hypothetical protein
VTNEEYWKKVVGFTQAKVCGNCDHYDSCNKKCDHGYVHIDEGNKRRYFPVTVEEYNCCNEWLGD